MACSLPLQLREDLEHMIRRCRADDGGRAMRRFETRHVEGVWKKSATRTATGDSSGGLTNDLPHEGRVLDEVSSPEPTWLNC